MNSFSLAKGIILPRNELKELNSKILYHKLFRNKMNRKSFVTHKINFFHQNIYKGNDYSLDLKYQSNFKRVVFIHKSNHIPMIKLGIHMNRSFSIGKTLNLLRNNKNLEENRELQLNRSNIYENENQLDSYFISKNTTSINKIDEINLSQQQQERIVQNVKVKINQWIERGIFNDIKSIPLRRKVYLIVEQCKILNIDPFFLNRFGILMSLLQCSEQEYRKIVTRSRLLIRNPTETISENDKNIITIASEELKNQSVSFIARKLRNQTRISLLQIKRLLQKNKTKIPIYINSTPDFKYNGLNNLQSQVESITNSNANNVHSRENLEQMNFQKQLFDYYENLSKQSHLNKLLFYEILQNHFKISRNKLYYEIRKIRMKQLRMKRLNLCVTKETRILIRNEMNIALSEQMNSEDLYSLLENKFHLPRDTIRRIVNEEKEKLKKKKMTKEIRECIRNYVQLHPNESIQKQKKILAEMTGLSERQIYKSLYDLKKKTIYSQE